MIIVNFFKNLSAFKRVVLALIIGILTGIIVGEPAGELKILGNAYIGLLQMTVLPYVMVSIIGGLGRLNASMAMNIGIKAGFIILFIWLATMFTLLLLPLAYPSWESASFFSTSLIIEAESFDFLRLYIPSNVFYSMSNTVVPAVVVFSLLLGIAMIHVQNKDGLINLTTNISDGLMRVASFVAKSAPIGIFAIAASAAGTIEPDDLGRLQIFLWVYLLAWGMLTLVFLPLLIHWATPFSYREIMNMAGEAMITALATGTVLVVLPMIIENCKELLKKHNMDCEETISAVDVLVPTAYSFPSVGTLLGLGFILFSAWYVGAPLNMEQYLSFVIMGIFSAFGSMAVAIPFMLDFFKLPADQFQLYLLGSVVTARFATALAALHAFVVTLLVSAALLKRLNKRRLFNIFALHFGLTAGIMTLAGVTFSHFITYEYEGRRTFESMSIKGKVASITEMAKMTPLSNIDRNRSRLEIIRERGTIRIGYFADSLPFAFRNNKGELVGYDMEMIHALALDTDSKIEFNRIRDKSSLEALLINGSLDIVIGGAPITPKRALKFLFSDTYTYHTLGLIVKDSNRDDYSSIEEVREMKDLKLYTPNVNYYVSAIKAAFPNAKIEPLGSPRQFFKKAQESNTAYAYSAEVGSAWTLLYPEFSVVVPKGLKIKAPVGFALPRGESELAQYINTWLKLKKFNGFQSEVYDYWILGKDPEKQKPRWSVLHNVFGWDI